MSESDYSNMPHNVGTAIEISLDDRPGIIRIVSSLRVAISNIRLYPVTSTIVSKSIEEAYERIMAMISKYEMLIIAESAGNLIANGVLIKKQQKKSSNNDIYNAFIQTLMQSHIKSLSFYRRLSDDDFSFFLKIFSEKHWRREGDMMVLSTILKEKGIDSIRLNEKIYRAVGEDDIVIDEGMDYLERNEGSIDTLVKSIEEVVDMSVFDEGGRIQDDVKRHIIDKIVNLKPEMLINFFDRKHQPKVEDLKNRLIEGIPASHLKEIIADIVNIYKELKDTSPASSMKELFKLKSTINKLMSSCKDRDTTLEIFNSLKDADLQELLPEWWNKPDKSEMGLLVSKGRLLTEKDALELLEPEYQKEVIEIIKEMDKIGKTEIIHSLLEKLNENFLAHTAATRYEAAQLYCRIRPHISSLSSENIADYMESNVIETIESEQDNQVYECLSSILVSAAKEAVKDCNYDKAESVLRIFRKHKRLEKEGFLGRSDAAYKKLEEIASGDILKLLFEDLRSRDRERQKNAYKVLIQMEDAVIYPVISAIKSTPDLGLREIMTSLLRKLGSSAILSMISELEKDMGSTQLIRLIEILPTLEQDEMVINKLQQLLNNTDPNVRLQVLKTTLNLKGRRKKMFLDSLEDDNLAIRKFAISTLGNHRDPDLFHIFKDKEKTLIEEQLFCEALSNIDIPEAGEYLVDRLKHKFFWQKKTHKDIIMTCIRAIQNHKSEDAEKMLMKLVRSKDQHISSQASYVLSNWNT